MAECVFFVTCPRGVDYLLGDELRELGLEPFRNAPAGVWARGDLAGGYRACLWSRLASRVILHLDDVPASNADGMLEATRALAWEDHIPVEGRFRVTFQGRNDEIRNTQFGAQKVKDGIVDRFREISGKRPSVDSAKPDVTVSARLNRGTLSLGIDLSGDSLHRRGYRIDKGQAPLRESLAAALLIRAGWPEIAAEGGDFYDPMCGSGTIAIEAAMMACDMAPGRKRAHWGFEGWKGHDPELWLSLRQEAERRAHEGRQGKLPAIVGHDQDSRVIATAWRNIQRAGLEGVVHVECQSIGSWQPEGEVAGQGLVLTNPPYGERLSEKKELAGLCDAIRDSSSEASQPAGSKPRKKPAPAKGGPGGKPGKAGAKPGGKPGRKAPAGKGRKGPGKRPGGKPGNGPKAGGRGPGPKGKPSKPGKPRKPSIKKR